MKLASPNYPVQIQAYSVTGNPIGERREFKTDLAGKQYGGRISAHFIRSYQDGTGVRWYELSQAEGRRWHGPITEEQKDESVAYYRRMFLDNE